MLRAIARFMQDDEGDWIALLSCGHQQHVRHRPPWFHRPWAASPEGRAHAIGQFLECRLCDLENATCGNGQP